MAQRMGQPRRQTNRQIIVFRIIGQICRRSNQCDRSGFHDTDRGGMFSGRGNRAQYNRPKAGLFFQPLAKRPEISATCWPPARRAHALESLRLGEIYCAFCGHPRWKATWNDGRFQHSNWDEALNLH